MDLQSNNIPPEEQYRQPGAFDHGKKNWFALHHVLAFTLFGLLGVAIIIGAYYYQISKTTPEINSPAHHAKDGSSQIGDTSDWKTYTNAEHGFEFEYPSNWELKNGSNYVIANVSSPETVTDLKDCFEGCGPDIEIRYYSDITKEPENSGNNLKAATLDDYVKKNPMISDPKKVTFSGYTAYEMTRGGFGTYYSIMIDKNSEIYEIFFYNQSAKDSLTATENQILSTFKFVTPEVKAAEVTTFTTKTKNYTDTKYNFSFDYPEKWILSGSTPYLNLFDIARTDVPALQIDLGCVYAVDGIENPRIEKSQITYGSKTYTETKTYSGKELVFDFIDFPLSSSMKTQYCDTGTFIVDPKSDRTQLDPIIASFKFK